MPIEKPILREGDLVFVRGTTLISKLIMWGQTSKGEDLSPISHMTGIVAPNGDIIEANLEGVQRTNLYKRYADGEHLIAIYRPINISEATRGLMVAEAEKMLGAKYGLAEFIPHLIDQKLFGGRVWARKAIRVLWPNVRICSQLWTLIYAKFRLYFGLDPEAAEPDDCFQFVKKNYKFYAPVWTLGPMPKEWGL